MSSKMKRCPSCNGLNVLAFFTEDINRCRDCKHVWGKDWDWRKSLARIETEVEEAFLAAVNPECRPEISSYRDLDILQPYI